MTRTVTETFFLPEEIGCNSTSIPADIYNLARTLLKRSEFNCVFVPIRSLQFLGVITVEEIVFVDSHAYACDHDQGGRLIMLAWKFARLASRTSLGEPVELDVRYYHPDSREIQLRLVGDFSEALKLLDQRDCALSTGGARIIKLERS